MSFKTPPGKSRPVSFAINPGYTVSSVRADGEEVPFRVGDYQEYNEAMLEVTLPAKEEMELEIRYGGFPREDRTTSTMQGSVEISREYICLTNASLSPPASECAAGERLHPCDHGNYGARPT